ncbi:hypothetical protein LB504_011013 [Fusarium proliferatum]|nr:hypothetical protein LB504_011013 [Fusarium proliferatum]
MGNTKDEFIDLHLFVLFNRTLYAVNVRKLRDVAFLAVGNSEMSLGVLLEMTNIPQVGFDISDISQVLFRQFNVSDPDKVRWLNPADAKVLRFYKKFAYALYCTVKRVEIFPSLYEVYNTKLSRLNSADWLHLAEKESEQRVHDDKRKSKKARTEKKSRGPEVFWED